MDVAYPSTIHRFVGEKTESRRERGRLLADNFRALRQVEWGNCSLPRHKSARLSANEIIAFFVRSGFSCKQMRTNVCILPRNVKTLRPFYSHTTRAATFSNLVH